MTLSRRAKLSLGLGATGVMLCAAGVWPSLRALHAAQAKIAATRAELSAVPDRPADLQRRQESMNRAAAFAVAYTKPMPAQTELAGLVRTLSTYLDELGIASREIATGAPVRTGALTTMSVSLTMRCDFVSACAVISHVEAYPRLVRVRRLRIMREKGPDGGLDPSSALSTELLLEALSAPDPTPPPGAKLASPEKGGEP